MNRVDARKETCAASSMARKLSCEESTTATANNLHKTFLSHRPRSQHHGHRPSTLNENGVSCLQPRGKMLRAYLPRHSREILCRYILPAPPQTTSTLLCCCALWRLLQKVQSASGSSC